MKRGNLFADAIHLARVEPDADSFPIDLVHERQHAIHVHEHGDPSATEGLVQSKGEVAPAPNTESVIAARQVLDEFPPQLSQASHVRLTGLVRARPKLIASKEMCLYGGAAGKCVNGLPSQARGLIPIRNWAPLSIVPRLDRAVRGD